MRSEHVAFQLVDNRHAAHRYSGGELVLDAADIGFARYTRFAMPVPRWQLGQDVDGARAAIADRLAALEVPLSADQAAGIAVITARVHGADKQRLTLKVNGRKPGKDASVELAAGWRTVAIPIARGFFAPGENEIAFETTGAPGNVALQWLRLGHASEPSDPRGDAVFDAAGSLTLARDASLVWYVTVPDGAHFVAAVSAPCKVELRARASDESFAGGLLAAGADRVDLSAMAGRVVALSLTARECPAATIAAPRITLHGPAAAARPAGEPPRYVILWVMDGLRADQIPLFTPGARARTPNLDELAKTSAVFRQVYAQGNEAISSYSSLWTGLYPAAGQAGRGWRIGAQLAVLAQDMAAAHYAALGVTGDRAIDEAGGFARGFTELHNLMREAGATDGAIYGQTIVDGALGALDRHRSEPALLFVGTTDTLAPWLAHQPWIDLYAGAGSAGSAGAVPGGMSCSGIRSAADVERLRAIYDSAVSYLDLQVGRLVEQLQAWGIWDQTMLILTADHGEELFEDQRCGDGGSLRDSLVRVPLLIHDPARFPADAVIDEGAEAIDVLPSVLAAVGAAPPSELQGAPLESLAQGIGRGWARPSYASQYDRAHAMRIGRWKIRVGPRGAPLVGDMAADPNETRDATAAHPIERRMLTDNLGLFLALRAQWRQAEWGVVTNVTPAGAQALDGASAR